MSWRTGALLAVSLLSSAAFAQQTVFNVPSADVLDRGKLYGEFDYTYRADGAVSGFTPRVVIGVGHHVEAGVNLTGISHPGPSHSTVVVAGKWKLYYSGNSGWALVVGDNVFVPVQNRTFEAGNYLYVELAKTWRSQTRISAGAYHFSAGVVAPAQRAGGQFAIEQSVGNRTTLAADWYTGKHSFGYFTPGAVFKLTSKLTLYAAYQLGNARLRSGNHQLLAELGYNLN